jgi:DNA-directed RNA polymerase specialized sigma24 family protein
MPDAAPNEAENVEQPKSVTADLLFAEASSDDLSRRETAEFVANALGNLTPNERQVVELKTYGGLTFREIAQVTGSPLGTVATPVPTL